MSYTAADNRYDSMIYKRYGRSGLLLPAVSLGFWKNFGSSDIFSNCEKMVLKAFDLGITHFDLANVYGPENGYLKTIEKINSGLVVFSPLAQGLLSGKYLDGIPENSRAAKYDDFNGHINEENVSKVRKLNDIRLRFDP